MFEKRLLSLAPPAQLRGEGFVRGLKILELRGLVCYFI
jgi:hypothetical protein